MVTTSDRLLRLVVIDDDPDLRALTRLNLELDESVEVVGEANGDVEGLRLIEQFEPDVAVIDLSMPGIDGTSLVRALRQRCSDLRIVAYATDAAELSEALAASVDDVVSKSGSYGRLLAAIRG